MEKGVIDRSDSLFDDEYQKMQDTIIVDYSKDIIGQMQDSDGLPMAEIVYESSNHQYNTSGRNNKSSSSVYQIYKMLKI